MKIPQKSFVQFRLRKLLLLVAVIALSLATFGPWGIAIIVFLAARTFWFQRAADRVTLIATWGFIRVLGSSVVHGHLEAYRIHSCRRNLEAIGMALYDYHDEHGQFPPQYVVDAEGRPMHGWRVLILPCLADYLADSDATRGYQEYRFDEPWNSPSRRFGLRYFLQAGRSTVMNEEHDTKERLNKQYAAMAADQELPSRSTRSVSCHAFRFTRGSGLYRELASS